MILQVLMSILSIFINHFALEISIAILCLSLFIKFLNSRLSKITDYGL